MARFDVYSLPEEKGYLLDVQADLLDHLNTHIVIPLLPSSYAPRPAQYLNPSFNVEGEKLVMVTQFMAAVPSGMLRNPITNLESMRNEIVAAIDFLMQGF